MGMMLKCRDVGVDCDFEAHGKNEAELLQKAAEHAKGCHQGVQMTPELVAKIKGAIKEEGSGCCGGDPTCSK